MPSALSDIEILQSQSLSGAVQDAVLRLIQEGAFEAGQKLNEVDIAKRLGVSRGPVREAFRGLEEARLLRLTKNRGVYVREISREEAYELYELRAGLDGLVGEMLAPRFTKAQLAELHGKIDEMETIIRAGDLAGYFPRNISFHDRIVEMAGNRKLLEIYRRLMNEMHLMRRQSIVHGGGSRFSVQEHRQIVKALASHDPLHAKEIMRDHVMKGRERLMLALASDAVAASPPSAGHGVRPRDRAET
jgi:phosphonate utilization transcriptional regulator